MGGSMSIIFFGAIALVVAALLGLAVWMFR